MGKVIYIQLLNEGSVAFRPVPAQDMGNSVYKVNGYEIYDPEDEEWEFLPGTFVLVEEQERDGIRVLIAIQKQISV